MCGRYSFIPSEKLFLKYKTVQTNYVFLPRYNVCPGENMPVVFKKGNDNYFAEMKWGLIPFWAKDKKIGDNMINARAETIEEKPSFKQPLKTKRCIIPASGFYEWKREGKENVPHYFSPANDAYFSFAGVYDIWKDKHEQDIYSYAIITTQANEIVDKIHDRMPVILNEAGEEQWLQNSNYHSVLGLLKPYDSKKMQVYQVSKEVNSSKMDLAEFILPQE
ncbi:MAG: hypothetical protein A2Y40_07560 [Candidatus Margulisbacteria bacterium GWF2_35_9]|nr:MAG: hypothetical protein A2Y40_07560 [Candidatus Margulisbacteria bacterium GWF2_35_9]